jgi:hypothetical protein
VFLGDSGLKARILLVLSRSLNSLSHLCVRAYVFVCFVVVVGFFFFPSPFHFCDEGVGAVPLLILPHV